MCFDRKVKIYFRYDFSYENQEWANYSIDLVGGLGDGEESGPSTKKAGSCVLVLLEMKETLIREKRHYTSSFTWNSKLAIHSRNREPFGADEYV